MIVLLSVTPLPTHKVSLVIPPLIGLVSASIVILLRVLVFIL